MGNYQKLIVKILSGLADASISFTELCILLKALDFDERTKGSHHVFRKEGVIEKKISRKMEIMQNHIRLNRLEISF